MPYTTDSNPVGTNYPKRTPAMHAEFIQRKFQECYAESVSQKQAAAIRYKEGIYLEFSSAQGHDLAIKSLEDRKAGIRLLNVHEDKEKSVIKATVYIPAGKESSFLKKIEDYANVLTSKGNPKNNDLVSSIDDIKVAMLDSFWVGERDSMPRETPVWCEIWLRYDFKKENIETWRKTEESISLICYENKIHIDDKHIVFPERIVKMVYASAEQLKMLIAVCPYIAEIRRAQEATTFFTDLSNKEQKEWIDDLLQRADYTVGHSEVRYASCQYGGVPYFSDAGRWASGGYTDLVAGDVIFFDWDGDGTADHTGLVIGTDGTSVYTVEGNSGDTCKTKKYALNSSVILGYGLMNW